MRAFTLGLAAVLFVYGIFWFAYEETLKTPNAAWVN